MAQKSEQYQNKLNYNNNYNKENYRSFSVRFSIKNEDDIIQWLSSKDSIKDYLKGLIESDIKKSKKDAGKKNSSKKKASKKKSKK